MIGLALLIQANRLLLLLGIGTTHRSHTWLTDEDRLTTRTAVRVKVTTVDVSDELPEELQRVVHGITRIGDHTLLGRTMMMAK